MGDWSCLMVCTYPKSQMMYQSDRARISKQINSLRHVGCKAPCSSWRSSFFLRYYLHGQNERWVQGAPDQCTALMLFVCTIVTMDASITVKSIFPDRNTQNTNKTHTHKQKFLVENILCSTHLGLVFFVCFSFSSLATSEPQLYSSYYGNWVVVSEGGA